MDNPFAKSSKHPKVSRIEDEHGSVADFIPKGKKWVSKLPSEYLKHHKDIRKVRNKSVDWSDSTILVIVNRHFTSVDHVEWINSVLDRIEKIKNHVERVELRTSVPDSVLDTSNTTGLTGNFDASKESALDFIRDVRDYVHRNLAVTEDQLKALNDIYERFDSTNNPLLKS